MTIKEAWFFSDGTLTYDGAARYDYNLSRHRVVSERAQPRPLVKEYKRLRLANFGGYSSTHAIWKDNAGILHTMFWSDYSQLALSHLDENSKLPKIEDGWIEDYFIPVKRGQAWGWTFSE